MEVWSTAENKVEFVPNSAKILAKKVIFATQLIVTIKRVNNSSKKTWS